MDPKLARLIKYIGDNSSLESRFLNPDPQDYLFMVPLLDEISDIFGIPKEDIGAIIDERARAIAALKAVREASRT